jgi:hypothetical protein
MTARIYQPSKTAMSSGMAKTQTWFLEFLPEKPRVKDPLTGWNGAAETQTQVRLRFDTLDAAKDYAREHGIAARVDAPSKRKMYRKSYSDNYAYTRVGQWTH